MRKILLASAGVMVMSAGVAYAACIPTPSCSSLGYEGTALWQIKLMKSPPKSRKSKK